MSEERWTITEMARKLCRSLEGAAVDTDTEIIVEMKYIPNPLLLKGLCPSKTPSLAESIANSTHLKLLLFWAVTIAKSRRYKSIWE